MGERLGVDFGMRRREGGGESERETDIYIYICRYAFLIHMYEYKYPLPGLVTPHLTENPKTPNPRMQTQP